MITKRHARQRLMAEMKTAYAAIDATGPFVYSDGREDWDEVSQAMGRYDGLKRAYIILTGHPAEDVAHEVVSWYITTPEYEARKAAS